MSVMRSFLSVACATATSLVLSVPPAAAQSAAELSTAGWHSIDANPGEASVLFSKALTLQPRDAGLHLGVGAAAYQMGRTADATRALQKALDLDPTLVVASKLLGEIAYKEGDLPLAIRTYERALVHAPESGELAGRLERLEGEMARLDSAGSGVERLTITISNSTDAGLAMRASSVLDSTYWKVAKLIGAFPAEPIAVVLNAAGPFRDTVGTPGWSGREFRGEMRIPTAGASGDLEAFDRVLAHELVHAMVSSMAPIGVPAWFQEGLAQYVEPADADQAERRLAAAGQIPWARMVEGLPGAAADDRLAYDASLLTVQALLTRIGRRATAVLDELADGHSIDKALGRFGFTLADLQADVAHKVGRSGR